MNDIVETEETLPTVRDGHVAALVMTMRTGPDLHSVLWGVDDTPISDSAAIAMIVSETIDGMNEAYTLAGTAKNGWPFFVSAEDISSLTVREFMLTDVTPPSKAPQLAHVLRTVFENASTEEWLDEHVDEDGV